jgi:hypothetical protein
MRLTAVLRTGNEPGDSLSGEWTGSFDRRRSARRSLRLSASNSVPSPGDTPVLILDISPGGLLIETAASSLSVDDQIEILLPDKGLAKVRVAWRAGSFFGCEFSEKISAGAISAALLKADPYNPGNARTVDATRIENLARSAGFVPELNLWLPLYVSLALWALIVGTCYLLR